MGITNQRETALLWERDSGKPLGRALTWQDTRTDTLVRDFAARDDASMVREATGLPLSPYLSAPRIRWLLDRTPGLAEKAARGEVRFGTMDSWLIWNLTGGVAGGMHITDVTNASRALLMNIDTLGWDDRLLAFFAIPRRLLPTIRPSTGTYGTTRRAVTGIPITAALGDQHAALFRQTCFDSGDAKRTYGTGSFLLLNTGHEPIRSSHGLLITVGYQLAGERAHYALEGSIAVTGSLVQWFRDQLGLIATAPEIETRAGTVPDNGSYYIVPAFSGLFAPYWQPDARGVDILSPSGISRGLSWRPLGGRRAMSSTP